jgi:hypothetical protein
MRVTAIFLLGISTLGCKDKDAPKPEPAAAVPTPQIAQPKVATPELPKLEEPTQDVAAWRKEMETNLPKVVPQLTDVKCEAKQCTAKLSAANEDELTALTAKLEDDDALQAIGAKHVVFSRSPQDTTAVGVVVTF